MAWLQALSVTVFRDPLLLWLGLGLPLLLWLRLGRPSPAYTFSPAALFPAGGLPRGWRVATRGVPVVLSLTGLALLIVALARPRTQVPEPVSQTGIDIVLCLDTSSSMEAQDLVPDRSRLALAKEAAKAFVAARPEDRIGLIAFARYPDVRCPLTLDHDALTTVLGDIEVVVRDGAEDATGIGIAVARAADVLQQSTAPSRVVILLTDGEENVALAGKRGEIPPAHAGQLCQKLGVRVYTIAVGVRRRTATGTYAELDTGDVEFLARRTGGVFHAVRDAGALGAVYRDIDELERDARATPRFRLVDGYLPFLIAGLLLILLGRLLARSVWAGAA